jgi:hypothetical protein
MTVRHNQSLLHHVGRNTPNYLRVNTSLRLLFSFLAVTSFIFGIVALSVSAHDGEMVDVPGCHFLFPVAFLYFIFSKRYIRSLLGARVVADLQSRSDASTATLYDNPIQ